MAQCLNYAYGALLGATGLIGRMNYVFAAGILLNVVGNWWVLPRHGAVGAAVVTLATQSFVAVVQAGLAQRWLQIREGDPDWARLLLLAAALVGVALTLRQGLGVAMLPGLCLLSLTGLGLAWGLRLIDPRQLLRFVGAAD